MCEKEKKRVVAIRKEQHLLKVQLHQYKMYEITWGESTRDDMSNDTGTLKEFGNKKWMHLIWKGTYSCELRDQSFLQTPNARDINELEQEYNF